MGGDGGVLGGGGCGDDEKNSDGSGVVEKCCGVCS